MYCLPFVTFPGNAIKALRYSYLVPDLEMIAGHQPEEADM